jgi:F0F1-type ATP synthase assembly protein I
LSNKDLDKKQENSNTPKPKDTPAMRWYGLGIEFGAIMGLFAYLGYKADQKFDTEPWLMVTGIIFAFAGMLYLTIKESLDL